MYSSHECHEFREQIQFDRALGLETQNLGVERRFLNLPYRRLSLIKWINQPRSVNKIVESNNEIGGI